MMTSVAFAAVLTITLPLGECRLDNAVITFVPPNTMHVISVSDCGEIKCWDRWVDVGGKRIGISRACSAMDSFTVEPPPKE
jgi:hypothetical protein